MCVCRHRPLRTRVFPRNASHPPPFGVDSGPGRSHPGQRCCRSGSAAARCGEVGASFFWPIWLWALAFEWIFDPQMPAMKEPKKAPSLLEGRGPEEHCLSKRRIPFGMRWHEASRVWETAQSKLFDLCSLLITYFWSGIRVYLCFQVIRAEVFLMALWLVEFMDQAIVPLGS